MKLLRRIFGNRDPSSCEAASHVLPTGIGLDDYVVKALEEAVPSGWRFFRHDEKLLHWTIERVAVPAGEWALQDYSLIVSDDLKWFIFTHGNNDIGCGGLRHIFLNAMVVSASSLKVPWSPDHQHQSAHFGLSECIRFLIKNCKPNEWGYT